MLAYIVGYIVGRLRNKLCSECQEKVMSSIVANYQDMAWLRAIGD